MFMDIEKIVEKCLYKMVVITGGEPTIHPLGLLINKLQDTKHYVCIETNGTNKIPYMVDWITVSPKPQSDFVINCSPNEIKYVVDKDFKYSNIAKGYSCPIWLQPESAKESSMRECYAIAMNHPDCRVGIQLHKVMEVR
jgi:organic radical activating enzyme